MGVAVRSRLLPLTALIVAAGLFLATAGCNAVNKKHWGFPMSSALYRGMKKGGSGGGGGDPWKSNTFSNIGPREGAMLVGAVAAGILAVDVLSMVVTVPHDLWVSLTEKKKKPVPRRRRLVGARK